MLPEGLGAELPAERRQLAQYLPALQGMARLLVQKKRDDPRLESLLEEVVMRSTDSVWRDWAGAELARRR